MSKLAMQEMAKQVQKFLPEDFGYVLLVFPFKENGEANYISNANRSDIVNALREFADVLENYKDYETPENNIY